LKTSQDKIIIFSGLSEQIYAQTPLNGAGYVHKQEKLEHTGQSIIKVNQGKIIMNETVVKRT
jgi:hypothetical protein